MSEERTVIGVVGEEGFTKLVAAFYQRIPSDPILGPMYPGDDMEGAEQRLRDFLIYRFGGSQRYIEQRGHPRLRRRHFPFPVDKAARDRWIELMREAFDESDLHPDARRVLMDFFEHTATFLINRRD